MSSFPTKIKILLILAKTLEKEKLNFSRSALFHMKTRVSIRYFVNDCRLIRYAKSHGSIHFFCFGTDLAFLDKFGLKNEICQSKLRFGKETNSNIHNSIFSTKNSLIGKIWSQNLKFFV